MTTKPNEEKKSEFVRIPVDEPPSKQAVINMLHEQISLLENGKIRATKAVVLYLDDTSGEGNYDVGFDFAAIRSSEVLALMEVVKARILNWMGHI